jgi:RimJ/RimL family protein N-acetyltransferase
VVIRHEPDNLASGRVAERAGFRRVVEGPQEEAACPDGRPALVWELRRPDAGDVS